MSLALGTDPERVGRIDERAALVGNTRRAVHAGLVEAPGGRMSGMRPDPVDGVSAPAGASTDCAVVEAAYRTLRYFSSLPALVANLDANYAGALSPSNLNGCTAHGGAGTSVGLAAANEVIYNRTTGPNPRWAPDADRGDLALPDVAARPGGVAVDPAVRAAAGALGGERAPICAAKPRPVPA